MIEAAQCLARAWNIGSIFGVSNASRVFKSPSTFADYDALWLEIGGVRDRNGLFRLPVSPKHHNLADVPSHHRSEYRKRMLMRDDVATQIEATLGLLSRWGNRVGGDFVTERVASGRANDPEQPL